MTRVRLAGPALLAALTVGACVDTTTRNDPVATTGSLATPPPAPSSVWRKPWLTLPAAQTNAPGEQTTLAWVPATGLVRGTSAALAGLGQPLQAAPGENRTVEACRAMAESEAVKVGAQSVEAVSAGPHRRTARGGYSGPVRMRITYARPGSYEVREAVMTCTVDRRGRIVGAVG